MPQPSSGHPAQTLSTGIAPAVAIGRPAVVRVVVPAATMDHTGPNLRRTPQSVGSHFFAFFAPFVVVIRNQDTSKRQTALMELIRSASRWDS
jgi:hypothetical protein